MSPAARFLPVARQDASARASNRVVSPCPGWLRWPLGDAPRQQDVGIRAVGDTTCQGRRCERPPLARTRALALVCALCAAGVAPGAALGATGTAPAMQTRTGPAGLVPTGFAPIPAVSAAPPARRTRAAPRPSGGVVYFDGDAATLRLRFVRPSPPALVGPRPARPPARGLAGTLPGGTHAGTSPPLNLTLLVWASFFAAAVIAGTAGLIHRVRTRPSGTTIFGRPTSGIDEWLARTEPAATTTPPPVEGDAGESVPEGRPDTEGGAAPVPRPVEPQ
jgi:hypothetical protein